MTGESARCVRRWLIGCIILGGIGLLLSDGPTGTAQEKPAKAENKGRPGPRLPEGIQVLRDVPYVPEGGPRQRLDLYYPAKAEKPVPLIVWVHGGAWQSGSKDAGGPTMFLLGKGFAVASINYRLSQQAVYPAQIQDCRAAIRWLRQNAAKYHLDGDHIGVWGSSAGGHLVALLGTSADAADLDAKDADTKVSCRVQAVVDFFGPTDLVQMGKMAGPNSKIDHDAATSPESKLVGGPIQQNKEKADRANPVRYVDGKAAPFLIVHGDADPLVALGQSELLHEALRKAGVESTLVVLKGAGHGGMAFNTAERRDEIEAFFRKHLRPKTE